MVKNKITTVIFDLDGVLVDTAKFHYLAWKRLAKELGCEFTMEDNERLKGVSRLRSLDILLEVGGVDCLSETEKLAFAEKKNEWYVEFLSQLSEESLMPGVKKLLIRLKANGYKIALGSASKNALRILEKLNVVEYFDTIVDGNMVSKAKPDPEVFLRAASNLGVSPESCIVFEDAFSGVEAAKRAGMEVIGIGELKNLSNANQCFAGMDSPTIFELFGECKK